MAKTKVTGGYIADSAITSDHLHTTLDLSSKTLTIGATTVSGHLIPDTNITYDLGSSTYRFRDIYLDGTTINLGGTELKKNSDGDIEFKSGSNFKRLVVSELEFDDGSNRKKFKISSGRIKSFDSSGVSDTADKISLSANKTDDLGEGTTNLYFTTARARSSFSASTGIAITDGAISAAAVPNSSLTNSSVTINSNSLSLGGTLTLDTDDIGEGSTNLYFTNARARGAISVSGNALSYNSSTGVLTANYEESPTFTGNVSISSTYPKISFVDTDNNPDFTIVGGSGQLGIYDETNAAYRFQINSSGNITVSGTVDGRDIAADGTKLDGIESGATADQTQAEINALGITAIGLSGTPNITVGTINSGAITSTGEVEATTLDINGNAFVSGYLNFDGSDQSGLLRIGSANVIGKSSNWLYIDPNTSFASGIYINNAIKVDGGLIGSYNEDLQLRTANTTALTLSNTDQSATFAGTVQATSFSDGTISGITFIDEDSFATNSATRVPTQQSIKAYVDAQVAGVVDTAPAALNTLNELAAALGDDANFSTTTSDALGNRLRVDTASQGLTGTQQANAITNLGITATKAELNYVDGVTSNIQTQLNTKITSSDNITGTSAGLSGTPDITVGDITATQLDLRGEAQTSNLDTVGRGLYYWGSTQPTTGSPGFNYGMAWTVRDPNQNIQLAFGSSSAGRLAVRRADSGTYYDWTHFYGEGTTISGDVSSSYNQTTNTLTLTVADDSHNHVISNVDGLQTALDSKYESGDNVSLGTINSGAITSSSTITTQAASAAAGIKIKRTNTSTAGARGYIGFMDSDNNFVASIDSRATGVNNSGDLRFTTSTGEAETGVYNLTPVLTLGTDQSATFAGTISSGAITSSASITASGNSNNFGNTTIAALSATSGTFSASITASGNSNSFGNSSFGTISSGAIAITTAAVPLSFVESGHTGNGQYWRMPLDGGNLRFDVSLTGGASFTTYDNILQLNSDGSINVQGAQMFDSSGNISTTKTISSGAITNTGNITTSGNIVHDRVIIDDYSSGTVAVDVGRIQIRSVGKTGWAVGDELGSIDFYNSDGSGIGARNAARIVAENNNGNGSTTTTFEGELAFYTSAYNSNLNASPALLLDGSNNATVAGTVIADDLDISGSLALGSTVTLSESAERADLLEISSSTGGWAGLQIRNTSNEGRWSFMTNGTQAGIYDDENNKWHLIMNENAATDLYYNAGKKFETTNTGVEVTGNIVVTGTVDGRDVASDGSKLDGIESGATADQTQAEINALGITATGLSGTPNITVGTIASGAIDSSGTSNFDSIQLTDASRLGFGTVKSGATVGHTASVDEGIFWHTSNDYGIYRTAGAWTASNYQQLKIKWATGIEIDGNGTNYGKSGINFLNGNIKMDGTQIIDSSRNLNNINNIDMAATDTAVNYLHVPRGGGITLYGDTSVHHGIFSRNQSNAVADDILISSYGAVYIDLDSNSNNSDAADFVIGRHNTTSQNFFSVDGENGNVNIAYDNAVLQFGTPGNGTNVNGCWLSLEGNTGTDGEGSGRLFFREHNSTTGSMDAYGMSIGYRGGETSVTTAGGNTWTGLAAIGNGQWGMWGHNGDNTGALIMYGDRAGTFVDFAGNNIQGISDIYVDDQIISTGDTNTYFQFHAADQCRIVCAGAEVMEWGNNYAKVNDNDTMRFGAGSDFRIWHDGTNNYIRNYNHAGGSIYFQGEDTEGTNHALLYMENGVSSPYVRLFENGQERLRTTSYGVDISGVPRIDGEETLLTNANAGIYFTNGGTDGTFASHGGIARSNGASFHISGSAVGDFCISAEAGKKILFGETNAKNAEIDASGNFTATSNVTAYSDERLKDNIQTIENGLETVKQLRGVSFTRNDIDDSDENIGVIAQEVEKVLPQVVLTHDDGIKSVSYGNMAGLFIEAIKEQQEIIEKLTARIEELEK